MIADEAHTIAVKAAGVLREKERRDSYEQGKQYLPYIFAKVQEEAERGLTYALIDFEKMYEKHHTLTFGPGGKEIDDILLNEEFIPKMNLLKVYLKSLGYKFPQSTYFYITWEKGAIVNVIKNRLNG